MLASQGEELFCMMCMLGLLITWMSQRFKLRLERLKAMQQAIDSGTLDEQTRKVILDALAGDQRRGGEWQRALGQHLLFLARNLVFLAGWLSMFIGGAIWLVNSTIDDDRFSARGGMIATFVGFALVTMPLALRELEGRRIKDHA